MIFYNPLDGFPLPHNIQSQARHCFLMTRLGDPVPPMIEEIRNSLINCCNSHDYTIIDAQSYVTGRDFLLKIWKLIASAPLSVSILHEDIPASTQANIFYELGVAQALGKETIIIKSPNSELPSDFVRSEYILFDDKFEKNFNKFMLSILKLAEHYEFLSDQLERNPLLSLDYLKRAFLINGDITLKNKAKKIVKSERFNKRSVDSVELLLASF